jgi:hypothetical protein
MERQLARYECVVTAGPVDALISVEVTYIDDDGLEIGKSYDNAMAFGYTWKDVAAAVRKGMKDLGLDRDPCSSISPHVDLT